MTTQAQLLPINTRVTHFDGGPSTHGKGTIVAYNGIKPNNYLKENFKEGVEMAAEAGLLGGVVNSLYDSVRCPYVVQWDYRQEFFNEFPHLKDRYPDGYRDVYETSSVNEIISQ